MMDEGWISIMRRIRNHWIWKDPVKFQWWIDILLEVNNAPAKVNMGNEIIECGRGQSLNSLGTWAKRWNVDISKVWRFFKLLKSDEMVKTENVKKTTRLTVCNYEYYQGVRKASEKQVKSKRKQTIKSNKDNKEVELPPFYSLFENETVKKIYGKYGINRDSDDNKSGKYLIPQLSNNLTNEEKKAEVARLSPLIRRLNELRDCYDRNGKLKPQYHV
jgi:hypothetical protein